MFDWHFLIKAGLPEQSSDAFSSMALVNFFYNIVIKSEVEKLTILRFGYEAK